MQNRLFVLCTFVFLLFVTMPLASAQSLDADCYSLDAGSTAEDCDTSAGNLNVDQWTGELSGFFGDGGSCPITTADPDSCPVPNKEAQEICKELAVEAWGIEDKYCVTLVGPPLGRGDTIRFLSMQRKSF